MSSSHALKIRLAPWALLAVSAAWGLSFVVMKDPIAKQSVNSFLFTRFLLAVLVMLALKPNVIKLFNREILIKGFIGVDPFAELLKHPAVANAPLILETPGMEPEHGEEIALLKKLRG